MTTHINDPLKMAEADALLWDGVCLLATANFTTAVSCAKVFASPYTHKNFPGISITYDAESQNLLVRSDKSPKLAIPVCYYKQCKNAVAYYCIACLVHKELGYPPNFAEDVDAIDDDIVQEEEERISTEEQEDNALYDQMDVDEFGFHEL